MATIRVTAEYVYTSSPAGVIRNGFVDYDETDGKIIAVGECAPDEEITPGALTPGFVNGHCHIELSHLHGKFRKGTGMAGFIEFRDGDATKMSLPTDSGILICNPPYGQRMMEQQSAQRLYAALGRHLKFADGWKKYIITSEPEFEHYFGGRADKKRKLYNGMIKCDYYMYTTNTRKK